MMTLCRPLCFLVPRSVCCVQLNNAADEIIIQRHPSACMSFLVATIEIIAAAAANN